MNTDMMMTGTGSVLMDILPVILIILLGISFYHKRSTMKKEEKDLKETIQILKNAEGKEVQ